MARRRRTSFAAPFVVVVAAAGCSSKAERPAGGPGSASTRGPGNGSTAGSARANRVSWTVARGAGDECHTVDECEPDVKCNPPPPVRFRCPDGAPATGPFKLTSSDGRTCYLGDSSTVVPCPDAALPPSPPIDAAALVATAPSHRRWAILRRGDTCQAEEDTCSGAVPPGQPAPPCNPPAPSKLACPPPGVTAIVETGPATCVLVREPNLGPAGKPVPCPP